MSIIEITRVEDIQPGDHVTLFWNGDDTTTLSGIVHHIAPRGFYIHFDIAGLRVTVGGDGEHWTVESATREVPDAPPLPTEPGSVIVNATIRGETGHAAFLDSSGDWRSLRPVGGDYRFHRPDLITAWEPGRIVPEGGAS